MGTDKPDNLGDFLEDSEEKQATITGGVYEIEIDRILPNPYQPRKYFDETALAELAISIKANGVIQPIVIRQGKDNQLFLVAGERRLKASQMAGLETIPAILTEGNPIEISLIENLQRENLKPVEEAEALEKMIAEFKYTQKDVARVIGKARSTVAEILSLNRLPEEIKDECRRADVSRRILIEVAKQKTPEEMENLYERIKTGNLTSEKVRKITRKSEDIKRRTPAGIAIEKTHNLYLTLAKLDTATISDEERKLLAQELIYLRKALDTMAL
ncbi:MAG: ParB/RepB/Spo0J family partition protein [Candidatus Omnitrophota bacterium]